MKDKELAKYKDELLGLIKKGKSGNRFSTVTYSQYSSPEDEANKAQTYDLSKFQTVNAIVEEFESLGYVTLRKIPSDFFPSEGYEVIITDKGGLFLSQKKSFSELYRKEKWEKWWNSFKIKTTAVSPILSICIAIGSLCVAYGQYNITQQNKKEIESQQQTIKHLTKELEGYKERKETKPKHIQTRQYKDSGTTQREKEKYKN